ncbi:MAG: helix-turn-helix transcriptional regulator [Thermoanaerobacteraceae bacterium]|nr:helix-turn-helix transcriptional regulator [Thermoanaerobacteraceae bacterium]
MFRINQIRKLNGITQKALAERIDITREHLSAIENGRKYPSISLLKKIAKELNTSIKALISDNDQVERAI